MTNVSHPLSHPLSSFHPTAYRSLRALTRILESSIRVPAVAARLKPRRCAAPNCGKLLSVERRADAIYCPGPVCKKAGQRAREAAAKAQAERLLLAAVREARLNGSAPSPRQEKWTEEEAA